MNMLFRTIATTLMGAAVIGVSTASIAASVNLPTQPMLTLDVAKRIADGAQSKANIEGWPCVISVVDAAGLPILLVRMDNAAVPAGVDLAPGKARTAALFRRPSGALEDAANGQRPAVLSAHDFVLMRGGLPIEVGGHIVGAIGVSADTPQHDEEIAKAGISALH